MNCIKLANSLGFLNNRKNRINCFSFWGAETGATYVIMKSSITLQPDWVRLWIMLENKLVLTHHIQVSNCSTSRVNQKGP